MPKSSLRFDHFSHFSPKMKKFCYRTIVISFLLSFPSKSLTQLKCSVTFQIVPEV
ncbi:hypothetical protein HanXRQr2_Chr16g0726501 [Helianthus annuus]|uniref:Uncharacterized protein n=1 Tax=Helianthus annuus TaxID=4232 RepID=A0A9K3DNB8_HELAN|nr:hypothetical protein HanXRQr2_Chr16g0726501 [Helianthus annuus]